MNNNKDCRVGQLTTYYVTVQEVILNKDGKTILPICDIIATYDDHRHIPSPDKN